MNYDYQKEAFNSITQTFLSLLCVGNLSNEIAERYLMAREEAVKKHGMEWVIKIIDSNFQNMRTKYDC